MLINPKYLTHSSRNLLINHHKVCVEFHIKIHPEKKPFTLNIQHWTLKDHMRVHTVHLPTVWKVFVNVEPWKTTWEFTPERSLLPAYIIWKMFHPAEKHTPVNIVRVLLNTETFHMNSTWEFTLKRVYWATGFYRNWIINHLGHRRFLGPDDVLTFVLYFSF